MFLNLKLLTNFGILISSTGLEDLHIQPTSIIHWLRARGQGKCWASWMKWEAWCLSHYSFSSVFSVSVLALSGCSLAQLSDGQGHGVYHINFHLSPLLEICLSCRWPHCHHLDGKLSSSSLLLHSHVFHVLFTIFNFILWVPGDQEGQIPLDQSRGIVACFSQQKSVLTGKTAKCQWGS